jgi:hypothetical protein
MKKINFELSSNAIGEAKIGFQLRLDNGFWNAYIRPGLVLDIGYQGGYPGAEPIFKEAIGLDIGTPNYNGRDNPYPENSVGTVHASHLLEHISDYGYFFRDVFRALMPGGTLILTVPLMQAYENRLTPLSAYNPDHKRFYTSSRLLYEIETSLPRNLYRVIHLRELFNMNDLDRQDGHAAGPFYEIECVLEKTRANAVYG